MSCLQVAPNLGMLRMDQRLQCLEQRIQANGLEDKMCTEELLKGLRQAEESGASDKERIAALEKQLEESVAEASAKEAKASAGKA